MAVSVELMIPMEPKVHGKKRWIGTLRIVMWKLNFITVNQLQGFVSGHSENINDWFFFAF